MNGRKTQIGFSQRIRLEWFEQTANLILAGNDKTIISDSLQDLLEDKVSIGGESARSNREKVITILLKTWITVPRELEKLRDEGLEILQRLSRKDRIAVHWGMVLAAYPFWGAVAAHTAAGSCDFRDQPLQRMFSDGSRRNTGNAKPQHGLPGGCFDHSSIGRF